MIFIEKKKTASTKRANPMHDILLNKNNNLIYSKNMIMLQFVLQKWQRFVPNTFTYV